MASSVEHELEADSTACLCSLKLLNSSQEKAGMYSSEHVC